MSRNVSNLLSPLLTTYYALFCIQLDTSQLPDMTKCCDKHDLCYDTCNSERDICDFDFKECLEDLCKKRKKKMSKSEYKSK